jgi:A/G-specific adenine glycosylase
MDLCTGGGGKGARRVRVLRRMRTESSSEGRERFMKPNRNEAVTIGQSLPDVASLRAALLDWYDAHKRDLKWRAVADSGADMAPHWASPDWPYRVWVSEVMLQQTTVVHATPYFERFMQLWPHVADLATADDSVVMNEWAGLGYYSRARNLIKCARIIHSEFNGLFPKSETELLKLPGFGPYTAAAVMAFGFGTAANVVDGNVERIMSRLYAVREALPAARGRLRELSALWVRDERASDWPQALMDLASAICRPKSPLCLLCPLNEGCLAYAEGQAESYPRKAARVPKPRRYGVVFMIETDDGVIVERRADKGLLGGMLGLPHTPWGENPADVADQLLIDAPYEVAGSYEHVFTHFALTQTVWRQRPDAAAVRDLLRRRNDLMILPRSEAKSLPTVFAKALKIK